MSTTQAERFPFMSATFTDYAGQDHVATATFWTLHLRAGRGVEQLARDVLATGCEALTGEWIGGDDWLQWAEPIEPRDPIAPALHLHMEARDGATAVRYAREIVRRVGMPQQANHAVISTAGDWAEQLEVFAR